MLIINRRKKHGVIFREIWNAEESCGLPGINLYRGAEKPVGRLISEVRTLLTDLTPSEEDIMSAFNKNTRYAIRRAARDGVTFSIKASNSRLREVMGTEPLTPEDIEAFCHFYEDFLHTKGISSEGFDKYQEELSTYVRNEAFAISQVRDQQGLVLASHTYIVGDDFVRSYHSASLFRDNKEAYALTGRANRYLHFEDMKYFKAAGIPIYDWGGAGLSDEVRTITEFKEEFGGAEHYYYDSEEAAGAKAAAVKGIINILS